MPQAFATTLATHGLVRHLKLQHMQETTQINWRKGSVKTGKHTPTPTSPFWIGQFSSSLNEHLCVTIDLHLIQQTFYEMWTRSTSNSVNRHWSLGRKDVVVAKSQNPEAIVVVLGSCFQLHHKRCASRSLTAKFSKTAFILLAHLETLWAWFSKCWAQATIIDFDRTSGCPALLEECLRMNN